MKNSNLGCQECRNCVVFDGFHAVFGVFDRVVSLRQGLSDKLLDYLKSLGFVELDPPFHYRLTAQGNRFVESPPQNYAALSLAAQEQSNRIAQDSNRIAQDSNRVAEKANEIAERANKFARGSLAVAIVSAIISIIALAK